MPTVKRFLVATILAIAAVVGLLPHAVHAASGAYEAELPADLATARDLCARVPCADVFPGAKAFSERKGQPPYVEAYGDDDPQRPGERKVLGYVVLSTDVTDTPAYSGKPVVTLIGMDVDGRYVGVKVLKHSEPILLLGIPESALVKFNDQYVGKSVKDRIEVGPSRPDEQVLGVDAISGATVTVIAQNQVMALSGAAVARQAGIIAPTVREPARWKADGRRLSWDELAKLGAVQRLRVTPEQVGLDRSAEPFIELWFGDLNHPDVGRSLLGEAGFERLRSRMQDGEHALFVVRTAGGESFKGSGFVRGGIFDRVQVKQGADSFTFRDLDFLNLYGLEAAGAPRHDEAAIFLVRSQSFSAAYPWRLAFLGNRVDRATGHRSFAVFEQKLWLDGSLMEGGRPVVDEPEAPWVRIWRTQAVKIGLFAALLVAVGVVYAFRESLTRRSTRVNKWPVNAFKYSAWALSIGFVGFGLMAQPSITQVLTWFHSILFHWTWSLFLTDPFVFLFWIFIIVTVFLFGRGLFCGWLCPFGSLSEAMYKLGGAIGLKRFQRSLPRWLHDRLKWLKYAVFFGLLAVSMFSMGLAEVLAEVEPFKTTFLVGVQNRAWPYGLYVCLLLGVSLFVERPYCKYVCPLGGALAMPSTFRWFGLRRKPDCNACKACATGCGSLAIDADGRIDHRECLHCLDCMVLYTDTHACPPLAKERKRRDREGQPLTRIGRDGYFIPIVPVSVAADDSIALRGRPDPRMPTDPVVPPALRDARGARRLWLEFREHAWPWSVRGWRDSRALQVAGYSIAIAATVAWLLAASGRMSQVAVIAWWFGWSVYEVAIRMSGRRYVKDGPWWGSRYRVASLMDMLSYVGFKNLLIGAALFLALRAAGVLGG